jgi:hypothetical protein
VGRLRGKLRQLQKAARGRLAWIDLPGGGAFYYDPEATGASLFKYAADTLRAERAGEPLPPTPEVLKVIGGLPTREGRERTFWAVYGAGSKSFISFDPEAFFSTGKIKPHPGLKRKPVEPPPDESEGVVRIGKPPDYLR